MAGRTVLREFAPDFAHFNDNVLFGEKGYATKLMERVIADCREQGRKGIVLTCKNELIKFYEQFGYINEGKSMSKHGGVEWYEMRLSFDEI